MEGLSPPVLPAALLSDPTGAAKATAAAGKDFEAMMLGQMLQGMFAGVSTDGPFGGGYAEETFRGLLLDAVAKEVAKGPGLGIAGPVQSVMDAYAKGKE